MLHRSSARLTAIFLLLSWPFHSKAEDVALKPKELLARYESFINGLSTLRFDSEETFYEKGGVFSELTWIGTVEATFVRKELRWRFLIHEVGFNYYDGRRIPFDMRSEATYDGKVSLVVNQDRRDARALKELDEEGGRKLLKAEGGGGKVETFILAEVDAVKPVAPREYAFQNQTNVIFGYMPYDKTSILDLLRQQATRLSAREDKLAGRPSVVLEGVTRYGVFTLWLDPGANYAPLRLQQKKAGNDLMGDTSMSTLKANGDDKDAKPNLPMRGLDFQVDYRIAPVNGRVVIVGYTRDDHTLYQGGASYLRRVQANLNNIRFDPSPEELEPTLPIPDGTRVLVRNAPGIKAKWSGGKLVMEYDKPTVVDIKANWVSDPGPAPFWRRTRVLAVGAALVLAVGVLGWRFRRTKA